MKNHKPTKKQIDAFNDVIKAIEKAKKLGLCFYGKQFNLVAYTKDADDYAKEFAPLHIYNKFKSIPCLYNAILHDSGADDYAAYKTKEDEDKYLND